MSPCRKLLLALAIMIAVPGVAAAQTTDGKPAEPEQALLKPEQLDALVAPIALYPDELLANVLAASTYPLEAVQADRWVKANKNLKGDALKTAVDKQAWDDSVKALAHTRCSRDDERQDRLDQESRRCRVGAAARRDGCGPAAARKGAGAATSSSPTSSRRSAFSSRRTRR